MDIKKFFFNLYSDKYILKNLKFWLKFFVCIYGVNLFLFFIILSNIKNGFADSIDNNNIYEIGSTTSNDVINDMEKSDQEIKSEIDEEDEDEINIMEWLWWLKGKLQFLAIFGLEKAHKKANDEWTFKDTRDWASLAVFLWIVKWLYFFWYLFFKS